MRLLCAFAADDAAVAAAGAALACHGATAEGAEHLRDLKIPKALVRFAAGERRSPALVAAAARVVAAMGGSSRRGQVAIFRPLRPGVLDVLSALTLRPRVMADAGAAAALASALEGLARPHKGSSPWWRFLGWGHRRAVTPPLAALAALAALVAAAQCSDMARDLFATFASLSSRCADESEEEQRRQHRGRRQGGLRVRAVPHRDRSRPIILSVPGLVPRLVALMQAPSVCESGAAAAAACRFVLLFARTDVCLAALVEASVADAIVALAMQPAVAASAEAAAALADAATAIAGMPHGAAALERAGACVVLRELAGAEAVLCDPAALSTVALAAAAIEDAVAEAAEAAAAAAAAAAKQVQAVAAVGEPDIGHGV